ncbi:MAG: CoA transferase [Chloroflexi bacterium]|nr:CoA transferase [Chloroflexota bacterium]
MSVGALAGTRVLEYGRLVAAPYAAKLLADMGAEVVKIEGPQGDPARRREPFPQDSPHPERSGLFLYVNTNKSGITLNLRTATGQKVLAELVKWADVLIEDTPSRLTKELGLEYKKLKAVNPQIIVCSLTPFGRVGPYKDYKGYGLNVVHAGGEGYLLPGGVLDRPPVKGAGHLADYDAGVTAAIAIVAALVWRDAGGPGQHIDVSQQAAIMAQTRAALGRYTVDGVIDSRAGRTARVGTNLKASDGYYILHAAMDHMWRAWVQVIGEPAWTRESRFQGDEARQEHVNEANALIEEWSRSRPKKEVERIGQAAHVPVGAAATPADLLDNPQEAYRGYFVEAAHPEAGVLKYPSAAYQLSRTPWKLERPAPLLGQHTEEVLGRLGYSQEDLVKMREAGVI